MHNYVDKQQPTANLVDATAMPYGQSTHAPSFQMVDRRPEAVAQRKLQAMVNRSPRVLQLRRFQRMAYDYAAGQSSPIQRQANQTGLPNHLKSGIERLSGYSMDDVKVHRNSSKPAQLQAHAYAQGTDIHLGPGQEKHLAHEAWHVVQQKQGRVKPTIQMKSGAQINDDSGLEREADVMGAKALQEGQSSEPVIQNQSLKSATPSSQPLQLKRETQLTQGVLNMIGETHTDYPNRNARRYEAKEIRNVLGDDYQYYTEGKLKVGGGGNDFADPVDQRLEQAIAFAKEDIQEMVGNLKAIDDDKLAAGIQKAGAQRQQGDSDAAPIVERFAPMIASAEFDEEAVLRDLEIPSGKYSMALAEKLSQDATWKINQYDPDGEYVDNFYAITDKFRDEFERLEDLQDEEEDKAAEDGGAEVMAALPDLDILEVGRAKTATFAVSTFFDKLKGRLPTSLKLYYHFKKKGYYHGAPHFKFDLKMVPPALAEWEKIGELAVISSQVMREDRPAILPNLVATSIRKLEDLYRTLADGVKAGIGNVNVMGAKEKRSLSMNAAAERLKNQLIVWKVGNLHIEDIIRLVEAHVIPEPGYAYITKEDFKARYIDEDAMQAHQGDDADLGPGYVAADANFKRALEAADQTLSDRLPWEDQIGTIEHLDLGNIIMRQTRVIVEAVEGGALPNLKTLIMHRASMTPDLLGRLRARGIAVTLT
ncbi:MAG: DUF4157 domain-containing protein [Bacteroidota bacterium]